jgi:hypothetical protein
MIQVIGKVKITVSEISLFDSNFHIQSDNNQIMLIIFSRLLAMVTNDEEDFSIMKSTIR